VSLAAPWITTTELETHLGAEIDADEADRLVYTATSMVENVVNLVDSEGEPLGAVPDAVLTVTLYVAAELYKAGTGIDGTLQVDWTQQVPANITSVIVKRYGALLAPWISISGLVG
jgi:hypothetical protein